MPFVKSNDVNIFYEERGDAYAEPLLLIMGITAPGSVWEPHVQQWENTFRCILPDNRGVGLSDKPAGPYSTAQMADDCAALIQSLNLAKVKVVGVSMGSTIAMQLAIRHPGKVKSLVLMCPWARCDNMAKAIFQNMMHCKARFRPEEFSLYIQQLIFSKSSWDKPEMLKGFESDRLGASNDQNPQPLHGLEAQAIACMEHDVLNDLPGINQPTLVIGGEEDIFTPKWMANEVANAIPNAELFLYPELGHAFHFENKEDFNDRVEKWLVEN